MLGGSFRRLYADEGADHWRSDAMRFDEVFKGTDGNDVLTGTSGDDLFKPKLGIDQVDGMDGSDTLKINYAASESSGILDSEIKFVKGSASGHLVSGNSECNFQNIESVIFHGSDADDTLFYRVTL